MVDLSKVLNLRLATAHVRHIAQLVLQRQVVINMIERVLNSTVLLEVQGVVQQVVNQLVLFEVFDHIYCFNEVLANAFVLDDLFHFFLLVTILLTQLLEVLLQVDDLVVHRVYFKVVVVLEDGKLLHQLDGVLAVAVEHLDQELLVVLGQTISYFD